ncbi:hypothetical protein [Polaromonas sp. C04]|uniref:hypothetical protein n=1 Tax=Polaromonas sp. C04 TaxID=1945857 RepID=UPI000986C9E9|nr:hypothetical protein [Polaromonas sp. C04]OOG58018.1 hypothetical protein B0E49_04080 [Polaromonas sp. C04]
MNEINTLQSLFDDVKGNEYLGDARKQSGYLKSISLLADAMARRYWQQFELDVVDELKELKPGTEMAKGLDVKLQLAQSELELADLQVRLMEFHGFAASGAFLSKEDAANSLRAIADDIEAKDSALFPKPWTEEDAKAYAKKIGANYIGKCDDLDELLARMKVKGNKGAKVQLKVTKSKPAK